MIANDVFAGTASILGDGALSWPCQSKFSGSPGCVGLGA
jgi:hypothetical protein